MESLPAYAAVELLVLAVAFFVEFEGAGGAETPQTYFAAVWFNRRLVPTPGLEESQRAVRILVPVGVHVLLMYQQPAVEEEGLPAEIAHERLSGTVNEHVRLELVVVREALAALLTRERLLSRVNANVPLKVVIQAELSSAYMTSERLLARVDYAVSFQSCASPVRLVTYGAYERSDARVFPLMHRERVSIFESLVAHWALVLFGVGVNHLMEAERVFTLELLPARRAAERSFLRVYDHVTPQLDRRLAGLVAILALQHSLPLLVA